MPTTVIYTTASRGDVEDFVRSITGAITGTGDDPHGVGAGFRSRLAFSFFGLVAPNFDKLGKGEIGANNESWQRNTPEYLAYGKGPKSSRMGRGFMPMNRLGGPPLNQGLIGRPPRGTGELTEQQLKRWWAIYMPMRNALFLSGVPLKQAKARAAAYAWTQMKKFGAQTLLGKYGDRPDQVLVDRGLLRRSLQPGYLADGIGPDAEYRATQAGQLVRTEPGKVVCGTNHPHAIKHHEGRGRLPERRLWPKKITPEWFEDMVDNVVMGFERIKELFQ